jgi:cobalamin biosynthesis protein CobT
MNIFITEPNPEQASDYEEEEEEEEEAKEEEEQDNPASQQVNPISDQANPSSDQANPSSDQVNPSSEEVNEEVIPDANGFNVDDVIIAGVEEALSIQVPFDMRFSYKSGGDPNAENNSAQRVRRLLLRQNRKILFLVARTFSVLGIYYITLPHKFPRKCFYILVHILMVP